MNWNELASISGKKGLFKVVKPTRTGLIVESLDEKKQRMAVNAHQKISVLEEISIFTNSAEGTVPLQDVMKKIYAEFQDDPGVDSNDSKDELMAFLKHIVPDYDEEKVYPSDVKKLVAWYGILVEKVPELLREKQEEESKEPKENKGKPAKKQAEKGKA